MQDLEGRLIDLYPGDYIVCPFASRQSTTHIYGILPKQIMKKGIDLNLLSDGGSVGLVTYIPPFMGKSTILEFISYLGLKKRVMNLKQFAPVVKKITKLNLPPVLLIMGTSSEIGKTTLTSRIMSILSKKYHKKVSSIMISCSGSKSDEIHHKAAGVYAINSFIQMGYPVTYDVPEKEYLNSMEYQFQLIADTQKPDIIVGEVGGDYIWGNNLAFIKKSKVMRFVKYIVVIVSDTIAAIGTEKLFNEWNIIIPYILANSWLRSYEGMRIRNEKILGQKLIDTQNSENIDFYLSEIYKTIFQSN